MEPEKRPDIVTVGGIISDPLLRYTDHLASLHLAAEKRVEKERRRTQKHFHEARRNRQDYQTLFQASQVCSYLIVNAEVFIRGLLVAFEHTYSCDYECISV